MIHKIYGVFDIKAEAYLPPMFLPTDGLAERHFSDLISNTDSIVGKHPADFDLHILGTFDDQNGELHGAAKPHVLAQGLAYANKFQTEVLFDPEGVERAKA